MRGDTLSTAWLVVLLTASPVHADFTKFSFAGNGGNASAPLTCPDWPFECPPPSVCAYESRTQNYYCCIAGSEDGVCWGLSQTCQGSNGKKPGGNQRLCGSGNNAFCCLQQSEVCTETADQINICWSSLSDPLAKLNATAVNETAHSLSSAQPSASSYPVSLDALQKLTSTTAASSPTPVSSSTITSVATSSTTSPSAATSSPVEKSDSGLSGGAIGGIVGGVVGGLALIGVAGLLLWRRKKNASNPYAPANSSEAAPTYAAETPAEMNAETYAEAPASEKYARYGGPVAEAPAESILAELPTTEPPHQR